MVLARTTLALAWIALAGLPAAAAGQSRATQEFAEYDPGRCVVAARVIDGVNRHDYRDTTVFNPARDTLFTATTERVRECEAAYGGSTTEEPEVLNVARVQLLTGQDKAAIATARRHMGSMADRPAEERAWSLYLILSDNLGGKPARLDRAREVLAELDALGAPAASVRTLAHYALMDAAIDRHDDELMRSEAAAVVKAWNELDDDTRLWRAMVLASTYISRAGVEVLARGGDAARAVIDTARGVVPNAAVIPRRMIDAAQRMYRKVDETAAPIEAAFWYNNAEGPATRPASGRVSLILPIWVPCPAFCVEVVDGARRIERRFRGQDLDITFRIRTYGFFADTAPVTPQAEAEHDSNYLLNDVKGGLPGALAIAQTEYTWLPDGRRVNEPTTDDMNYPGARVVVVDRNGIIQYVADMWNPVLEARITELIERLLKEKGLARAPGESPGGGASPGATAPSPAAAVER
jgi:hypothetical protein